MIIDVDHDLSLLQMMENTGKYDPFLKKDQPERINIIREITAGIAHEIRNPMTTVRGLLQLLQQKKECSLYQDLFKVIIQELDKTNEIITELLFLSSKKATNLTFHNLNDVILSLRDVLLDRARQYKMQVTMDLADLPELLLNREEIRRLILNLAQNGLEAMPTGGNLQIKTFMEEDKVVLTVQDQGEGIEPEALEKLGIPFYTTKEESVGLGLAVCYGIAARHNARIEVHTGSLGSTFAVYFETDTCRCSTPLA